VITAGSGAADGHQFASRGHGVLGEDIRRLVSQNDLCRCGGIVDRGIVICRDDVVRRIRHVAVIPIRNVRCVVTRSVRRLVDEILGRRHRFRYVVDRGGVPRRLRLGLRPVVAQGDAARPLLVPVHETGLPPFHRESCLMH
jgi:hypothetical protein